jgi:hypothetical protein
VSQLNLRIGTDEARSELLLTLAEDRFDHYWNQIEDHIQNYADVKLELVRNWEFEKKNITSKRQLYTKQIEKFLRGNTIGSKNNRASGQSEELIEEIGQSISEILEQCINSISDTLLSVDNNQKTSNSSSRTSDPKCQNKFISFEISNILCKRVEEILYDVFLAPVCNTVNNNLLRDADASLIRQLSQSRRNLVKSFTMQNHFSRLFLPQQGTQNFICSCSI